MKKGKKTIGFENISKLAMSCVQKQISIQDYPKNQELNEVFSTPKYLALFKYIHLYFQILTRKNKSVLLGTISHDLLIKYFTLLEAINLEFKETSLELTHRWKLCELIVSDINKLLEYFEKIEGFSLNGRKFQCLNDFIYFTCIQSITELKGKRLLNYIVGIFNVRETMLSFRKNINQICPELEKFDKTTCRLKKIFVNVSLGCLGEFKPSLKVTEGDLNQVFHHEPKFSIDNFVEKAQALLNVIEYLANSSVQLKVKKTLIENYPKLKNNWCSLIVFLKQFSNDDVKILKHLNILKIEDKISMLQNMAVQENEKNSGYIKVPLIIDEVHAIEEKIKKLEGETVILEEELKTVVDKVCVASVGHDVEVNEILRAIFPIQKSLKVTQAEIEVLAEKNNKLKISLSSKIDNYKRKCDEEYQEKINDYDNQLSKIRFSVENKKNEIVGLKKSISKISSKVKTYKVRVEQQLDLFKVLKKKELDLDSEIDNLNGQVSLTQSQNYQLKQSISSLHEKSQELNTLIDSMTCEKHKILRDSNALNKHSLITANNKIHKVKIGNLNSTILELKNQLNNLEIDTQKMVTSCQQMESEKTALTTNLENVYKQTQQVNSQIFKERQLFNNRMKEYLTQHPEKLLHVVNNKVVEENIWELCQNYPSRLCQLLGDYFRKQEVLVGEDFFRAVFNNSHRLTFIPISQYLTNLSNLFQDVNNSKPFNVIFQSNIKFLVEVFPFIHDFKGKERYYGKMISIGIVRLNQTDVLKSHINDRVGSGLLYLCLGMAIVINKKISNLGSEKCFYKIFSAFKNNYGFKDDCLNDSKFFDLMKRNFYIVLQDLNALIGDIYKQKPAFK